MQQQVWQRGQEKVTVGLHPMQDWLYLYRDGAYWIKGWTYLSMISEGWTPCK